MKYPSAMGLLLSVSLLLSPPLYAHSPDKIWDDILVVESTHNYRALQADMNKLNSLLAAAPREGMAAIGEPFYFPLPNNEYVLVEVFYSPVMAPELEQKFPELKTYKVFGENDQQISGRIGLSPKGFYGYLSTDVGGVVLEAETKYDNTATDDKFRVFLKKDAPSASLPTLFEETLHDETGEGDAGNTIRMRTLNTKSVTNSLRRGSELKVYRTAISMQAELTQNAGGTVGDGMALIVKAINRVNQIYEQDLAIRLELVADNDKIVYTNPATDPFSSTSAMTGENASSLNTVIGVDNYDVGHVLDAKRAGGDAAVGQVCNANQKGRGRTSIRNVSGSGLDENAVDVLAHELGHQFWATHTQNTECNRYPASAWEVHSGSTVMGYAGVCSPTLQGHSDARFHAGSQAQIINYVTNEQGAGCGSTLATGDTPPILDAGPDYTIPVGTPFTLSATATDADGDSISYTWDQMDLGPATNSNPGSWIDSGSGPLFRSFAASSANTRTFPRLSAILADDLNGSKGESLPQTDRNLNFRVTARSGSYGMAQDDVQLTVTTTSGPFKVLAPVGTSFSSNQTVLVEWRVAGTDAAPVNCLAVDIDLSVDGGNQLNIALADETLNDGGESVTLPSLNSNDEVRIRVKCSDNVFFAVSPLTEPVVEGSGNIYVYLDGFPFRSEGNSGVTDVVFRVVRDNAEDLLTLDYAIEPIELTAGAPIGNIDTNDISGSVPLNSSLSLAPGEHSKDIVIGVVGDKILEPDEILVIQISNPSSGSIYNESVTLVIENDDLPGDSDSGDSGGDAGSGDPSNDSGDTSNDNDSGETATASKSDGGSSGGSIGALQILLLLLVLGLRRRKI